MADERPLPARILSVEDYYRVKDFYEVRGRVFNPALEYGSPAAYHLIAQAKLRASTAPTPENSGRKPRGRKKADYETVQHEARLAADWKRARDAGVYKADFAKQHGMTTKQLDRLLERVARRKKRSDK